MSSLRPMQRSGLRGLRLVMRDDAGREHLLCRFTDEDAPEADHPVVCGSLARLRSAAAARGDRRAWIYVTLVIVASATIIPGTLIGVLSLVRAANFSRSMFTVLLLVGVTVSVVALVATLQRILLRAMLHRADLVTDAVLRIGRCAACGYPLASDANAADGLQHCAECGAAWRDERVGKSVVPAAKPGSRHFFAAFLLASAMTRSSARDDAGRHFSRPPRASHGKLVLPGEREINRALWPQIVGIIASSTVIPLAVIVVLVTLGSRLGPVGVPLVIVASVIAVPLLILAIVKYHQREADRILLRQRICIACRQPLVPKSELLVCPACDATWDVARRT